VFHHVKVGHRQGFIPKSLLDYYNLRGFFLSDFSGCQPTLARRQKINIGLTKIKIRVVINTFLIYNLLLQSYVRDVFPWKLN